MDLTHYINLVGIILLPTLFFAVMRLDKSIENLKSAIGKDIDTAINHSFFKIDRQINKIEESVKNINERLKHRSEIAHLKYTYLEDKINYLEEYLERTNGFKRRLTALTNKAKTVTLTDDSDVTGLY